MFPKQKRIKDPELLALVRREPCCICGQRPAQASHLKTRGSGGDDVEENLVAKCQEHHNEWGSSMTKFCKKYPIMIFILEEKGWTLAAGKLRRK